MRHVNLDQQPADVREFVLTLPVDADGAVLEMNGAAVLRVMRVADEEPVDAAKLEAAILARRDASRELNAAWEDVDREAWSQIPNAGE